MSQPNPGTPDLQALTTAMADAIGPVLGAALSLPSPMNRDLLLAVGDLHHKHADYVRQLERDSEAAADEAESDQSDERRAA